LFSNYGAEAGLKGAVMPGMEPKTVATLAGMLLLAAGAVAGAWWLADYASKKSAADD
jgi:hypothetical protein